MSKFGFFSVFTTFRPDFFWGGGGMKNRVVMDMLAIFGVASAKIMSGPIVYKL